MSTFIRMATAGNVLASALATLKDMGYQVSRTATSIANESTLLKAEKPGISLQAEDPLLLLGLAKLAEVRGEHWQPTDIEVDDFVRLLG